MGERLARAGYEVTVVDVEVPFEISEKSIHGRWQESYEAAVSGEDLVGGRWVPSEYARDVFNGPGGVSKPEHAARVLADGCGAVTEYRLYRLDAARYEATGDRTPQLEVVLQRGSRGGPLLTPAQAQVQRIAAAARPPHRGKQGPSRRDLGRE